MRTLGVLLLAVVLLAQAERSVGGHPWVPPLLTIDAESLQQLTLQGRPVLAVDIRPGEAYRDGHLPGARSIPLSSLPVRRNEVPPDTLVVLYGGDGLDEAATAYRYLRGRGHANVVVLEGGLDAWRAQGYRVQR
jgi:rhodanese-related sulfurtransferase